MHIHTGLYCDLFVTPLTHQWRQFDVQCLAQGHFEATQNVSFSCGPVLKCKFLIEYQYLCRLGGDGRLEGGGDWLETKHFAAGFFLGQSHLLGDGGQYLASTLTHCRSAQCDFYWRLHKSLCGFKPTIVHLCCIYACTVMFSCVSSLKETEAW